MLEAIYAAYAEGWSDPAGTEARRRNLADEAIWLGRLVASLLPDEPEALGLLALMLYAQARRDARRDAAGRLRAARRAGSGAVGRAADRRGRGAAARAPAPCRAIGRYQLEAAVQSAHVVRRRTGRADWAAIERIYDALLAMTGSPVVAINRAVAVAETRGAAAGLAALDALADDARLADYQPYWAARAGLLARTGDVDAADEAYERAIGLEADPAVRRFLQRRRAELRRPGPRAILIPTGVCGSVPRMKSCLGALLLCGWLLMMPPAGQGDKPDVDAPIREWDQRAAYDTAKDCENGKISAYKTATPNTMNDRLKNRYTEMRSRSRRAYLPARRASEVRRPGPNPGHCHRRFFRRTPPVLADR